MSGCYVWKKKKAKVNLIHLFISWVDFQNTNVYVCIIVFYTLVTVTVVNLFISFVGKGDVPLSYIVDQTNRTAWITEKVNLAKSQFMDGINIDIEQAVEKGSPEYYALTDLVKETTMAFHREIPGSQVKDLFIYFLIQVRDPYL